MTTQKIGQYDWYDDNIISPSDRLMWALLKINMPMHIAKQAYERKGTKMDITFFEMRDQLKTAGMCYAIRSSKDEEAWVVYYDVEENKLMITDWVSTEVYYCTIDDLEAHDWCIYRYL